jgi:hypothetical protein
MDLDERACPDCAETVKKAAKVCRHCGYRFELGDMVDEGKLGALKSIPQGPITTSSAPSATFGDKEGRILLAGVAIVPVLIGLVIAISSSLGGPEPVDTTRYENEAKAFIIKDMLDPSSVQFRDVSTSDKCVTGEINAKNSFGAYVGFKGFYYSAAKHWGQIRAEMPEPMTMSSAQFQRELDHWSRYSDRFSNCLDGYELDAPRKTVVPKDAKS